LSTTTPETLVSWTDVQDIELAIVRRMHEYMAGAHASVFQGSGFDFVGLRDWQPGDRLSAIDWSQSTLTNFSPLITREFEQQSTARIVIIADTSVSTRCGGRGVPIAMVIARAVATFAMAGAFFQDQVGLITFDGRSRHMSVRPQVGKNHAMHCLDAYQDVVLGRKHYEPQLVENTFDGLLRKTSMAPVVSDFLFEDYESLLDELLKLQASHDTFVVLVDCRDAYDLPVISDGWIEAADVETGQSRLLSSSELEQLGDRIVGWQDTVEAAAQSRGLEVLRISADIDAFHGAVVQFLAGRRLRKR